MMAKEVLYEYLDDHDIIKIGDEITFVDKNKTCAHTSIVRDIVVNKTHGTKYYVNGDDWVDRRRVIKMFQHKRRKLK